MIEEIKSFEQRKEELVKKGKEKGFITYEELAKSLKGLDLDSDSLSAPEPSSSSSDTIAILC